MPMSVLHPDASPDETLVVIGKMLARLVRSSALERGETEPALRRITEMATSALRVERASVWRFTEDKCSLVCLDLYEASEQRHSSGQTLSASTTPRYFAALLEERTIAANDAHLDDRTSEFETDYLIPNGIGAMLDSPIWLAGQLIGVVCHEHIGVSREWAPWEQLVAGTFADLASMVLGAAERAAQARSLAEYGSQLETLVNERTQRLHEEQRLLQTVFATAPFGLAFFDREGRYQRVNPWLARLNGTSVEEAIGKRPGEIEQDPEIARRIEELTTTVLANHAPCEPVEVHRGPPESQRSFLVSAYPIGDDAGVACSFVDVTAQREGERERTLLLERERAARQEAEAASRAKDEFLAMLGHELRNPLAPIQTALDVMKRLGDVAAGERAVIERQVSHLKRLVDDMLDVSRITKGKLELRCQPVELAEAIAKGVELASPLIERRGHFLSVDVVDRGLLVSADVDRLAQVVANLLSNAAKFTPRGGRIHVRGLAHDDHVAMTVSDTGVGVSSSLLPAMFDAFVQGVRELDQSQGGLGLGLAIARGIVSAHGGEISVHSEGPGRGSLFEVRMPKFKGAPRVEPPVLPPPPTSLGRGRRVLIVDDNEDAARMIALALKMQGFDTTVAFDGPTAVAVASEFKPHAALLDLGLPVMDGFEVASRLRSLGGLSTIRLIAVTGYGRPDDRERTRKAGFDQHVVKPLDMLSFERMLADILDAANP